MFPKQARYMTAGISESVPEEIQQAIWQLLDLDQDSGQQLDYLQVFELSTDILEGKCVQRILQKQEQPPRRRLHVMTSISEPIQGLKLWVMDSGDYFTMLLPQEY